MDTQIILFGLWVALMLTYLLGDVLRLFAGDYQKGKIMDKKATQGMWMFIAILMVSPIVMSVLTLILPQGSNQITNIVVAAGLFLFNVFSVNGYPGYYDRFLIVVGLAINVLTIAYAFNWA